MRGIQICSTAALAGMFLSGCGRNKRCQIVQTPVDFDAAAQKEWFTGRWYAQAQMINENQPADSFNCVTADYMIRDPPPSSGYTIDVFNRGEVDNGDPTEAPLCALDPGGRDNDFAKVAVAPCFIPSFLAGAYWILVYNQEEGYGFVSGGQPNVDTQNGCYVRDSNSGMWVFTRDPIPAPGVIDKVKALATAQGIDVSVMLPVRQTGCVYPNATATTVVV